MKLIHDLLYKILVYIENHEEAGPYSPPDLTGYSVDQIHYHIKMCVEAGWLRQGKTKLKARYSHAHAHFTEVGELTWAGHKELERIHNGE